MTVQHEIIGLAMPEAMPIPPLQHLGETVCTDALSSPSGMWQETAVPYEFGLLSRDPFGISAELDAETAVSAADTLTRLYRDVEVFTPCSHIARATRSWYDVRETPFSIFNPINADLNYAAPSPPEGVPAAYIAFKETADWLGETEERLADLVGIGRTTPSSWKRDSREPRGSTTRSLYELHTILWSIQNEFGVDGLRTWLNSEAPTRKDVILAGKWNDLSSDVWRAVFEPSAKHRPDLSWRPEPDDTSQESSTPAAPSPQARRIKPRRGRVS